MFDDVFITIVNMTWTASIIIAAVFVARLILRRAPKVFSYALWGVVLFRLLCPVSFESMFSVVPKVGIEGYSLSDEKVSFASAATAAYEVVGDATHGKLGTVPVRIDKPDEQTEDVTIAQWWEVWVLFGKYVWVGGMLVIAVYSMVSLIKLRRRLVGAVRLRDNIYLADGITSSFVVGIIRPRIYLVSTLSEQEQEYILLHEQTHIRRCDHIIKLLAFLALALHWFNPLVWVSFICSMKDMEMSCDEAVMRKTGEDIRCDYSASLLRLATGRRIIAGMPLAFGEGDTKGRIKNMMKYKKPTAWVSMIALIALIVITVVCVGFSVNPKVAAAPAEDVEFVTSGSFYNENLNELVNREHLYTVANDVRDMGNTDRGLTINLCKYFVTDETMSFMFALSGEMLNEISNYDHVTLGYKIIDKYGDIIYDTQNDMENQYTAFAVQGRYEDQIILEAAVLPVGSDGVITRENIALTDSITMQIYRVRYYDFGISYESADSVPQLDGSWTIQLDLDTTFINMPIKTYEVVNNAYAAEKGITINLFTSSIFATQVGITFETDKNDYPLAPHPFSFFVTLNESGGMVENTIPNSRLAVESTMAIMVSGKDIMQEGGFSDNGYPEEIGSSVTYSFFIYSPTIYLDDSGYVTMCFEENNGEVIEIVLKAVE